MSEEPVPSQTTTNYKHLFRVTAGRSGIVRWCERCGATWIMQALVDILDNRTKSYLWKRVDEDSEDEQEQ
jgi:hypothetical protein